MSKRFTDTEKWSDPWFRGLSPHYQRLWIFLLDKCDQAGVWVVDRELAEFFLKETVDLESALAVFKDRVFAIKNGSKWFIPKFLVFQYGALNDTSKPHNYVLRLLLSHEIEGYPKGINTLKDKDKDKDKDQDKNNGAKIETWKPRVAR